MLLSLARGLPGHLLHFLHIKRDVQGNILHLQDSFLAGSGHSLSGHLLHVDGHILHTSHLLPLQNSSALSLRVHGDSAHGHIINNEQILVAIDCGILHGLAHVCHQHLLGPQVVHPPECGPSCTSSLWTPITCTIASLSSSLTLPMSERT